MENISTLHIICGMMIPRVRNGITYFIVTIKCQAMSSFSCTGHPAHIVMIFTTTYGDRSNNY
jgi:hypothetical protein